MSRRRLRHRSAHRRQRQEGMVMLVVMMLILMATSTGVWAMQSSVAEQKASTSLIETSLAQSDSECSAMAGVVLEEVGQTSFPVDPALLTKYYLPTPLAGSVFTRDFANANGGFACGADSAMRAAPVWQARARRIHETFSYGEVDEKVPSGRSGQMVVITGYGELGLAQDPLDQNLARGVHEVIAISRAYFDIKN